MPEVHTFDDWVDATGALGELPTVRDVGYRGDALDVVLTRGVGRVPPSVCRAIGESDLGISDVHREGERLRVVVA